MSVGVVTLGTDEKKKAYNVIFRQAAQWNLKKCLLTAWRSIFRKTVSSYYSYEHFLLSFQNKILNWEMCREQPIPHSKVDTNQYSNKP